MFIYITLWSAYIKRRERKVVTRKIKMKKTERWKAEEDIIW